MPKQGGTAGLVDSHTHLVFGGYRPDEFLWRMSGMSYMEIMERGGGILNTMKLPGLLLKKNWWTMPWTI